MTGPGGHRARASRSTSVAAAVLLSVLSAGCTRTVSGEPVGSGSAPETRSVAATVSSSGQTDFDLRLTIVPVEGTTAAPQPSTTPPSGTADPPAPGSDLAKAVTMVLGGVTELPDGALDGDIYGGTVDGLTSLWLQLPGATESQIAAARSALVGTWDFGLREVISGVIDPTQCAALLAAPQSDRLCDPATQQVLFLGRALPVRPATTTYDGDDPQPGVTMTFTGDASGVIAQYSAAHVGDRLAITDGRGLISAPTVQSAITGGAIRIAGNYTADEARALVGKLQLATAHVTITSGS